MMTIPASCKIPMTESSHYSVVFLSSTTFNCWFYHIVGFFEVLKFCEWLIFGFFTILFSRMGLPKAHTLQRVVGFFRGVKFHENQHPRNSRNLRTSKKTNWLIELSVPNMYASKWKLNKYSLWMHNEDWLNTCSQGE